jgi:glycosyltransferase involved in cell wall biosynthesis
MGSKFKILQLIDSLSSGGAERVAVNLANALADIDYDVKLCTTRTGGVLKNEIAPNVGYFSLNRKFRFDIHAFFRFVKYIQNEKIQIIHAHTSSLFFAVFSKLFVPSVKVIWHEHCGAYAIQNRSIFLYKWFARKIDAIIVVNNDLTNWIISKVKVPKHRVWYLPNFIVNSKKGTTFEVPGKKGYRIVSVANLRPPKDQLTLLRAMNIVIVTEPDAHLFLLGANKDEAYANALWRELANLHLESNVTWMGSINDVQSYLKNCDIAVLSSSSEGLPLALLEYGLAGLPVVATRVGDCPIVLEHGEAGILLEPGDFTALSQNILILLSDKKLREDLGIKLHNIVLEKYSVDAILPTLESIYSTVMKFQ